MLTVKMEKNLFLMKYAHNTDIQNISLKIHITLKIIIQNNQHFEASE